MEEELSKAEAVIGEARTLLDAAGCSLDNERRDQLIVWARETLASLVEAEYPPAMWLQCALEYEGEWSEEELDGRYREAMEKAAAAGSVEAQFRLACILDEEPTVVRSAELFQEAAEAGHAHAMWCHGLNLISGRGIERNEAAGLEFIRRSAELKFEGAIQFVSHCYMVGGHGFPKEEAKAAEWWKKLSDPDVIGY